MSSSSVRESHRPGFPIPAVAAILIAIAAIPARAYAQLPHDDKAKAPFGELTVSTASLSFTEIKLSSKVVTESKTFKLTDSGTGDITVTVGTTTGDAAFIVTGGGTIALAPKAHATITVEFAPADAGQFKGDVTVSVAPSSGQSLKGKASTEVKLSGSAKGKPPAPTPTPTPAPTAVPTPGTGNNHLSGTVESGTLPVCNSTVTLYAAGQAGSGASAYGAGATTVTDAGSNSSGAFDLTFNCPSSGAQMYAIATGGVAGSCTGSNSALVLATALGPCGSMPPSIVINEATTVASVWALQQFMDPTGKIVGTSSTNTTGLQNAAVTITSKNLIDVTTGLAPSSFPSDVTSPTNVLYTLADLLWSCTNTASAGSTQCASLFADAKASGGTPTNTLEAARDIAANPANNVSTLFALTPSNPPFTPDLSSAPPSWVIAIGYSPNNANQEMQIAIDAGGNVWAADANHKQLVELAVAGGYSTFVYPTVNEDFPLETIVDTAGNVWTADHHQLTEFPAGNYANPVGFGLMDGTAPLDWNGILGEPGGTAIFDLAGNIWLASVPGFSTVNGAIELIAAGGYTTEADFTNSAAGLNSPVRVAIDPSDNVWLLNGGSSPSLSELIAANYASGGANYPLPGADNGVGSIAIDASGDVFVINTDTQAASPQPSVIERIASNGHLMTFAPPGANLAAGGPLGISLDGAGNLWLGDSTSGGVSELTLASGYQNGFYYNTASGLPSAVDSYADASGNLWVVTKPSDDIVIEAQLLGLAAPTRVPAQACLTQESTTKTNCLP
jgi:hypothetical protein